MWPDKSAKAHQKDVDPRRTLKIGGKVRYRPDGTPLPQIGTPGFGYKSHIRIDRRCGLSARHRLPRRPKATDVNWLKSCTHHRKFKGKPMPERTARANAAKVSGEGQGQACLCASERQIWPVHSHIGLARAKAKLTLTILTYNFDRRIFHERRTATG